MKQHVVYEQKVLLHLIWSGQPHAPKGRFTFTCATQTDVVVTEAEILYGEGTCSAVKDLLNMSHCAVVTEIKL